MFQSSTLLKHCSPPLQTTETKTRPHRPGTPLHTALCRRRIPLACTGRLRPGEGEGAVSVVSFGICEDRSKQCCTRVR